MNPGEKAMNGIKTIYAEDYIHPLDRQLMDKVYGLPTIKQVIDSAHRGGLNDVCNYIISASYVKLPPDHYAHELLREICGQFSLDKIPELYIKRSYDYSLELSGYANPAIIISDKLAAEAGPEIMKARLIGGAAGICAGHHKLDLLLWLIESIELSVPILGTVIEQTLNEWSRCRGFTTDRAVYMVTGDGELALKNILYGKIPKDVWDSFSFGGGKGDTFWKQVDDFYCRDGIIGKAAALYGFLQKEEQVPRRYKELHEFINNRKV